MPMAGCHKSRGKYIVTGGESSRKGGSPPFPMWQRPRFGNLVCEVRAKSAQSDSFRAYRVECAKSSCFPALPTCWTCAMPLRRRRPPKYRLEIHHAGGSEKAACILCYNMESPKRNFHPSSAQLHHKHSDIREYGGMERSDADLFCTSNALLC